MQDTDQTAGNEEEIVEEPAGGEESPTFRYQITAYGADYPVDALVKRIASNDIIVPTFAPGAEFDNIRGFQREFVWSKTQSDKFIESLLLGLPVPGIFLVVREDGRLLVLDGQQRLMTLHAFYEGVIRSKEYSLENVQNEYLGKTYKSLDPEIRRKLDDSIIHATIVRQDEPSDDQSSVYMVFERLNTGGTALQPQEIRVALYGGPFIRFLHRMNESKAWRDIYGRKSNRLKDQELILRFFALLYRSDEYRRPMKEFLNGFAGANRDFKLQGEASMESIFIDTTDTIRDCLGSRAFRLKTAINVAVMDSVMIGIACRIQAGGPIKDLSGVAGRYRDLIRDKKFLESVESSTTDEKNVEFRLKAAKDAMQELD